MCRAIRKKRVIIVLLGQNFISQKYNFKPEEFVMEQITLNVKGMSCSHCVNSIEGSVGKIAGVSNVKVNLSEGKVDVSFNSEIISIDIIIDTIEEQGYDVE
jgi:copper chaperone